MSVAADGSDEQTIVTYAEIDAWNVTNGKLSAKHSFFAGAASGLGSFRNSVCVLGNCTFTKNTDFGLQISGNATLTDCIIEGNGSGVKFDNTDNSHTTTLTDCTIRDNTLAGVYTSESTMTFDAATLKGTTVTGSKVAFEGRNNSDLTFDDLTPVGSSYGIANYGGALTLVRTLVYANSAGSDGQ